MPHLKSIFPNLVPVPDYLNVYDTIAGRPELDEWKDYVVHVEVKTGKTRWFKELRERINDLATILDSSDVGLGFGRVEDGEMIGIVSDNSSDFIVLMIALLKIATPFALISCYSTPFELRHAMSIAKVSRLFVAQHYLSKVVPIANELGIENNKVYVMNVDSDKVKEHKSLEGLIRLTTKKNIPRVNSRIVPKDTVAYLLFSSGTSGLPKAVIISHGNELFALRQTIAFQQHRLALGPPPTPQTSDGRPVYLAFLPLHHTFGLHAFCIRVFLTQTRFIILQRWNVDIVLKAIPKYKVTNLSMVPSMAHQLANHPKLSKTDLSSLSFIYTGAAYLPREISSKIQVYVPKNTPFHEGYGMSETTVTAIITPFPGSLNGRFKDVPSATGVLLPGMEARIVRDDGTDADFDEIGELWLKGGNIVQGYWNNPKATRETFVDGWLLTGDKFRVDKEEYFYFADRVKDTLKVSGSQVSPMEIEEVLLTHPKKLINDVTVAGVSGGRTGDEKVPRAWIVLSDTGKRMGVTAVVKELDRWHKKNLSRYKWIKGGYEVLDMIPKSPTGKTLRRVLQERYEEQKGRAKL